jgi:hypothetical protein
VNPVLIVIGSVLAVFGAIVLAVMLASGGRVVRSDDITATIGERSEQQRPSPAWSILAGISLAVGAGCIGIGMNRWTETDAGPPAAPTRS